MHTAYEQHNFMSNNGLLKLSVEHSYEFSLFANSECGEINNNLNLTPLGLTGVDVFMNCSYLVLSSVLGLVARRFPFAELHERHINAALSKLDRPPFECGST